MQPPISYRASPRGETSTSVTKETNNSVTQKFSPTQRMLSPNKDRSNNTLLQINELQNNRNFNIKSISKKINKSFF